MAPTLQRTKWELPESWTSQLSNNRARFPRKDYAVHSLHAGLTSAHSQLLSQEGPWPAQVLYLVAHLNSYRCSVALHMRHNGYLPVQARSLQYSVSSFGDGGGHRHDLCPAAGKV